MTNPLVPFLFDDLDIRGAVVQLDSTWQRLLQGRAYNASVTRLLGEMAAVTALIGANLKQIGRIGLQLAGHGPIRLLVLDCTVDDDSEVHHLGLRGMARLDGPTGDSQGLALLGDGQLVMTLDLPGMKNPYQSIVPREGDSIAEVFEHFLTQSEQQPSRLWLFADGERAAGLLLQKMPGSDLKDPDGWDRISHLAQTARPEELTHLSPHALLTRLFHEETVRAFDQREVSCNCREDREKIANVILSMGQEEAMAVLEEHGQIVVQDDLCHFEYTFSAKDVQTLFELTKANGSSLTKPVAPPPTLH